jgi:hypothetical protein
MTERTVVAGAGTTLSGLAARARQLAGTSPVIGFYVTVRGAIVVMAGVFLFCSLVSGWLSVAVLSGLGYLACCVLAPLVVRRDAQLQVVIAPPTLFLAVLVLTQIVTAQGTSRHGHILSVLEGTTLTLAALAPWLLAGTALGVAVAMARGLPECAREFVAGLRGEG